MKRENAILTYTNTLFYPLAPQADEVKIEDIAHALSQMCRANGHFKTFYSVAQHSINCAQEARARGLSDRIQLACLLHDASEAYISDITRPVKCYLDDYRKIENHLQQVIYGKFGITELTAAECRHIQDIDNALLHHEFECLHYRGIYECSPQIYATHDVSERCMTDVENEFMQLTRRMLNSIAGKSYKCVGIDSCKKTGKYYGWTAFWIHDGGSYGFRVYHTITDIMADHHAADCLLIDIPIGLPENEQENRARPDSELRSRLKGKTSSVFNTPCRQAVYCLEKQEAKSINLHFVNKSLSEQSLGFSSKIKEVDEFLWENPQYTGRIRESHPEFAFSILNGGKPLMSKKKESIGVAERRLLLSQHFTDAEKALNEIMSQYPKFLVDDFVDAMVLAVIGCSGVENGFETIPEQPANDSRGLPMQIVYGRTKDNK
jgi:predicted RNase H-like nuclease